MARRCALFAWVLVAGGVVAALATGGLSSAKNVSSGGQELVMLSAALKDLPGTEMPAAVVAYGPDARSPAHHHAGSVFAYVLEGAVRSQNSATGAEKVFRVGESFFEPAGSVHLVSENASASDTARLLAVFVAPADVQLTTPEHSAKDIVL